MTDALSMPKDSVLVAKNILQSIKNSAYVHDFIVLSYKDLLDIFPLPNRDIQFINKVLGQVDLTMVSPFVVNGPVPDTMFFGRDSEIKKLLQNSLYSDFAIVGNRKVGKTSLLKQVQKRLTESGKARPMWIDCQAVRTPENFLRIFQSVTGIRLPAPTVQDFSEELAKYSQGGIIPILLIDEVDELLLYEKDHGETLLAQWRALAQQGICHFIFCGGRGVIQQLDDPRSAFFNFPQSLPLDYLDFDIANQVLTQPLKTMGVTIDEPKELLDEIYDLTSGHPNLIQYIGKELVESANKRKERGILIEDLHIIRHSTDFAENYLRTIWGAADPLEKIITLAAPASAFTYGEIQEILLTNKIKISDDQIRLALRMLIVYSVLEKYERRYKFKAKSFYEILHRTQEVNVLLRSEISRLTIGNR